jgi:hypothetical protein
MQSGSNVSAFRRNLLPSNSGYKKVSLKMEAVGSSESLYLADLHVTSNKTMTLNGLQP